MENFKNNLHKLYKFFFARNQLKEHIKRGLVFGSNSTIQSEVIIDISHTWLVEIGDDVIIAPRVHILAHDASTNLFLGYTRIAKVIIGNRVFIGASAIIMPGVKVGNDVVVGAGSIVTKDVPDGTVVAGNPARVICSIDDFIKKNKTDMDKYPCFDESYTIRKGITAEMKEEMKTKMKDTYGFIK